MIKRYGMAIAAFALFAATGAWAAQQDATGKPDRNGVRSTTDGVVDTPIELHGKHDDQHGGTDGHIAGSVENMTLVGKLQLPRTNSNPGIITDVWSKGNYAYLGTFAPPCAAQGVNVVDISDPANPEKVRFLPSRPGTRVNDVKVFSFSNLASGFSGDLLMHSNEGCSGGPQVVGGISIWDVTNIPVATKLASGVGDTVNNADGSILARARAVHNVFAWQDGDKAYAVLVDDEELLDVDILDITDPSNPVLISESGLPDWPSAVVDAFGSNAFLHDIWVQQIDGRWTILLSYWDAGFITLDVTDPANPVFLGDSDYPDPDPLVLEHLGKAFQPEGNAHAATWNANGSRLLAGDEDFSAYRLDLEVTSGPLAGQRVGAGEFGWTVPVVNLVDGTLNGPTVFGGYGCTDDRGSIPAATTVFSTVDPGEERIVVFQRGPVQDPNHDHDACNFSEKIESGQLAGYDAVIIANHHVGSRGGTLPEAFFCGGQGHVFTITALGACIGHRFMHEAFGVAADYTLPYPVQDPDEAPLEPQIGTLGPEISAGTEFDGWGPLHLIDADSFEELDAWAPDAVYDEGKAQGFGDLTMHNIETDPDADIAYISWYSLGMQIVGFDGDELTSLGHYIDPDGNNFWGVHLATDHPSGEKLILGSDRDSGLWIFKYTPGTP